MQKIILTNYKLDSNPELYHTKSGTAYYVFFTSAIFPTSEIYLKFSCQAWSIESVERLKLHKGSIIDLTADLGAYQKNGTLTYYLDVKDISIANIMTENTTENCESESREKSKREKQADLLRTLEDNPWGE